MALNPLIRLNFFDSTNPPWASGDECRVYWDDSANTFSVTKNGTTLTDPSYQITLGLSITYDANGVATTHYTGTYLLTTGLDGPAIDLPVGDPPVFIQSPVTTTQTPTVLPLPGPNNDVIIPPVAAPVIQTPTPTQIPVPVTKAGKIISGNGIDAVNYPVDAPTNFIP